jgi:hypothetical protein
MPTTPQAFDTSSSTRNSAVTLVPYYFLAWRIMEPARGDNARVNLLHPRRQPIDPVAIRSVHRQSDSLWTLMCGKPGDVHYESTSLSRRSSTDLGWTQLQQIFAIPFLTPNNCVEIGAILCGDWSDLEVFISLLIWCYCYAW